MSFPNGMQPRYYGRAANNPNAYKTTSINGTRNFVFNYIPDKINNYGLKLLLNNNIFALSFQNKGAVGTTASSSRAYNRGRDSLRNLTKTKFNRNN